jgi:site-specific recombinase XerD
VISRRGPKPPGLFAEQSDEKIVAMWIHGRAPRTRDQYGREIHRLRAATGRPLLSTRLEDLQLYGDSFALRGSSSRHAGEIIKSFFGFAHSIGATPFNVAAAWRLPKKTGSVAMRILTEEQVHGLIGAPDRQRDRCLIRVLYAGGLRVSEACRMLWAHAQPHGDAGVLLVTGKGERNRSVRISPATWRTLQDLRGAETDRMHGGDDEPIFRSRQDRALHMESVRLIVRNAGRRVGLRKVSPHWLRHSHASHALDRGAPIHVVRETLGHASVATTGIYLHARPGSSSALFLPV